MKTFHQFMEQVPHMEPNKMDVMRAKQNAIASMRQRRHVHQELSRKADYERKEMENLHKLP